MVTEVMQTVEAVTGEGGDEEEEEGMERESSLRVEGTLPFPGVTGIPSSS